MGNRRHHKKLRAEARAVMATTGESYQQVLTRILSRGPRQQAPAPAARVALIASRYFGLPITLATFEILGELSCVLLSSSRLGHPHPRSPLLGLARRREWN